jgi:hypothetical protein
MLEEAHGYWLSSHDAPRGAPDRESGATDDKKISRFPTIRRDRADEPFQSPTKNFCALALQRDAVRATVLKRSGKSNKK